MQPAEAEEAARFFWAMSRSIRVEILGLLSAEEMSPIQISERGGRALASVSYHVRKLHEWGFIKLIREEQRRGAWEHFYRASGVSLGSVSWGAIPNGFRSPALGFALNQFGQVIDSMIESVPQSNILNWRPVLVDAEGRDLVLEGAANFEGVVDLAAQSSLGRVKEKTELTPMVAGIAALENPG